MTVAIRRVKLVLQINNEGKAKNAWFKVQSIHRSRLAARRRAIKIRKSGALARVVSFKGYYLVATRRPRKIAPASWQLNPYF